MILEGICQTAQVVTIVIFDFRGYEVGSNNGFPIELVLSLEW